MEGKLHFMNQYKIKDLAETAYEKIYITEKG